MPCVPIRVDVTGASVQQSNVRKTQNVSRHRFEGHRLVVYQLNEFHHRLVPFVHRIGVNREEAVTLRNTVIYSLQIPLAIQAEMRGYNLSRFRYW